MQAVGFFGGRASEGDSNGHWIRLRGARVRVSLQSAKCGAFGGARDEASALFGRRKRLSARGGVARDGDDRAFGTRKRVVDDYDSNRRGSFDEEEDRI